MKNTVDFTIRRYLSVSTRNLPVSTAQNKPSNEKFSC